jgi:hypothetical protein
MRRMQMEIVMGTVLITLTCVGRKIGTRRANDFATGGCSHD